MPTVQFWPNAGGVLVPLFVDGQVAMDPSCCCGETTCCPTPPEEMLFSPPDSYGDEGITGGFPSLIPVGGDPLDPSVCEGIRGNHPYTLQLETLANPLPVTPCAEVNNWVDGLPGAATANWFLEIADWAEFYVNHVPGIGDFGCTDLEGEHLTLLLQVALRTIVGEGGVLECWYYAQVAFYTDGTSPQVCRYYSYEGIVPLTEGETCLAFFFPQQMTLDVSKSSETVPDDAPSDDCWGCAVTSPPTHGNANTIPV